MIKQTNLKLVDDHKLSIAEEKLKSLGYTYNPYVGLYIQSSYIMQTANYGARPTPKTVMEFSEIVVENIILTIKENNQPMLPLDWICQR
jgi:hypothetical protein